ncbi:Putative Flagellin, Flp1-like, domain [Fontibacillus panacisegetis]|uniref:Putative Flagellin, Flp1-like, domain n=1 Tax=Fontibacillus panacisegetis TaxID=670482 RepID=A0A1G7NQH9_9BACL|nr:Flp1 family type IVb pilin [Fontibacillus panacisegetis]SDF76236.1 Putative Flagellin, Flp1-like, domain [Fontibacillus panacisegetis]
MLSQLNVKLQGLWRDERGLGMLEMILIIAVIVIIAIIFRDKLSEIVESLLDKADSKTDKFMDAE